MAKENIGNSIKSEYGMLQASGYVNILSCRYNVAIVASIFLNEDYQNIYNIFSPKKQVKVTYKPHQFPYL